MMMLCLMILSFASSPVSYIEAPSSKSVAKQRHRPSQHPDRATHSIISHTLIRIVNVIFTPLSSAIFNMLTVSYPLPQTVNIDCAELFRGLQQSSTPPTHTPKTPLSCLSLYQTKHVSAPSQITASHAFYFQVKKTRQPPQFLISTLVSLFVICEVLGTPNSFIISASELEASRLELA